MNEHADLLQEVERRLGPEWRREFETVLAKTLPTGAPVLFADDICLMQDVSGNLLAARFHNPKAEFAAANEHFLEWELFTAKRRLRGTKREVLV